MFELTGQFDATTIKAKFSHGLAIEPLLFRQSLRLSCAYSPISIPGMSPYYGEDALENEVACWMALNRFLTNVKLTAGEVPSAPPIPEGAIA